MRLSIILTIFLSSVQFIWAQKTVFVTNKVENDTVEVDFGKLRESQEYINYDIVIKNVGEYTGKILKFETSCDCITSKAWNEKSIEAGKVDTLSFRISIDNRPGLLNKTIVLKTDGEPSKIVHILKAYVIPSFESVEEQYPYKTGDLWFELRNKFVSVGNITDLDTISERVYFYNASSDTLSIKYTQGQDSSLVVAFEKRKLAGKQGSYMDLTYYPSRAQDYGHVKREISFFTSEELYPKKQLYFHAYVMPYVQKATDAVPIIKLDSNIIDFGEVSDSISVDKQLYVMNEGHEVLMIKQLKTNCECLKAQAERLELAVGEKTLINVILDPRKRLGDLDKRISVFTNDPENPVMVIDVKAEIKPE